MPAPRPHRSRHAGPPARLAARALPLLLAVGTAACARRAAPTASMAGADTSTAAAAAAVAVPTAPIPLRIENHHRTDVVVYLLRAGGVRVRLGTVTVGGALDASLPPALTNDPGGFALVAHPIGGRYDLRSETVRVRDGQRVVWTLEAGLARSSVGVY